MPTAEVIPITRRDRTEDVEAAYQRGRIAGLREAGKIAACAPRNSMLSDIAGTLAAGYYRIADALEGK